MTGVTAQERTELLGLTQDEVCDFMIALDEKPYRARQLYDARFRKIGSPRLLA